MADIENLKRLAGAAKADGEWFEEGCALYSYYEKVDADFIVAASPDVVLELIAENEALQAEVEAQRKAKGEARRAAADAEAAAMGLMAERDKLRAELEQARKEGGMKDD